MTSAVYDVRWLTADPQVVQVQIWAPTAGGDVWHRITYPKSFREFKAIVRGLRALGFARIR